MVTLHSFDEEPKLDSSVYAAFDGNILLFNRDYEGTYHTFGFERWQEMKSYGAKGWLYESELMQLIKNGTRSE